MSERPIIFTGPMVRAILDDRKTQTRRVLKAPADAVGSVIRNGRCDWVLSVGFQQGQKLRFQPGDLLWVQETWCGGTAGVTFYRAGFNAVDAAGISEMYGGWRSSTHMPRWASRITLRVTDVRVQRVQEISGGDAVSEGVIAPVTGASYECRLAMDAFPRLWNSIHAKRPERQWAANPWVMAITFERVKP